MKTEIKFADFDISSLNRGNFYIITKGIPGCGKSTFAREIFSEFPHETLIVNRDTIRKELNCNGTNWTPEKEKEVVKLRNFRIKTGFNDFRIVINDDTNIDEKTMNELLNLNKNREVIVVNFLDVPIQTCIDRDAKRQGVENVGYDVIMKMARKAGIWKDFPKREKVPLRPDAFSVMNSKFVNYRAVICDLDGTLFHLNGRDPYDTKTVYNDTPNFNLVNIIHTLYQAKAFDKLFLFSGRKEDARSETLRALADKCELSTNNINMSLIMRSNEDNRNDVLVKYDMYKKYIEDNFRVYAVFDDRQSVVELWQSLNLPIFAVGNGSVF